LDATGTNCDDLALVSTILFVAIDRISCSDAFASSLCRSDLIELLGRTKPKTVSELMEIAKRFPDGEDAYHSKRACSPEYDGSSRQRNQRCRPHNEDSRTRRNQVAARYERLDEEGGENEEYHKKDNQR
jgi:hypothetical protein